MTYLLQTLGWLVVVIVAGVLAGRMLRKGRQ